MQRSTGSAALFVALLSLPAAAFERALAGYEYEFPRDHFAHPSFEIEWWYYTGNLFDSNGRRFGFELTFFRNAVERDSPAETPWDVDQIYLAHFTLSDLEAGRFHQDERVGRAGPGLAGASLERRRIWNRNWEVRLGDDGRHGLRAVAADFEIDLNLVSRKAPVIHGERGVSQKAAGEGKASHYISLTRLEGGGTIRVEGESYQVEGAAWMDHEFSSDSLGAGQIGWDWVSAQLDDGSELMIYRMRRDDGSTDPYSAGTYVDSRGRARHLRSTDFEIRVSEIWTSPSSGGRYPLRQRIRVPALGLELDVTTPLDEQEVVSRAGPTYWEGAVDCRGTGPNGSIAGTGYLELSGYDKPLRLGIERGP